MGKDYKIGFTATYIQDHPFKHLITVPIEVAVAWVRQVCPESDMSNSCKAKNLTIGGSTWTDATGNGWLNKLFVIVANDHGQWVAITNWDGKFSIYVERDEPAE